MQKKFIEVVELCKKYGKVVALDRVSFTSCAKILALIGPNGAGKTTFVKIASGLLRPTSGRMRVLGLDVENDCAQLKPKISLMPQDASPDSGCTPFQHVVYYLFSRGYSLNEARYRAKEILEKVGLWEYRNTQCLKLSGGMKRLVLLAMVFAPEVDAVFLDEPTSGLDPVNKVKIWSLITRLAREGVHILVTSHDMEEVEEYADEVVMINRGKIVAQGTPSRLLARVSSLARIEITLWNQASLEKLRKILENFTSVKGVYCIESTLIAYVNKRNVLEVVDKISEAGVKADIKIQQKCSLKDVFLRCAL